MSFSDKEKSKPSQDSGVNALPLPSESQNLKRQELIPSVTEEVIKEELSIAIGKFQL